LKNAVGRTIECEISEDAAASSSSNLSLAFWNVGAEFKGVRLGS
jgi:hypothetical protein